MFVSPIGQMVDESQRTEQSTLEPNGYCKFITQLNNIGIRSEAAGIKNLKSQIIILKSLIIYDLRI